MMMMIPHWSFISLLSSWCDVECHFIEITKEVQIQYTVFALVSWFSVKWQSIPRQLVIDNVSINRPDALPMCHTNNKKYRCNQTGQQ
jgi:hypothetical protein